MMENLDVVKKIVEKGVVVFCVCLVVKCVCEVVCKSSGLEIFSLLGKLVDCFFCNFEISEFYIVEGDLVGGLVK